MNKINIYDYRIKKIFTSDTIGIVSIKIDVDYQIPYKNLKKPDFFPFPTYRVSNIYNAITLKKSPNVNKNHNLLEAIFYNNTNKLLITFNNDKQWELLYNRYHKVLLHTDIPEDIYVKGLVFTDDSDLYYLYENEIFKIKLLGNRLVSESCLKGVALDKINQKLSTGTYNKKTGCFYFGSTTEGLYEIIPNHFDASLHKTPIKSDLNK